MRLPHLEQELDYSCLAACVRMVLAFHGSDHSEAKLRALFKTRPGGTSPVNVMLGLSSLGFDAFVQTGSRAVLRENLESRQPVIVHVWTRPLPYWDKEAIHAQVVTHMTGDSVLVHDPALQTGPTEILLDTFLQSWAATDYLTVVIRPLQENPG